MESYPSGPITNYGLQLLTDGTEPQITYISPEGEVAFYLNGGLAPWPGVTEGAVLQEGISGLHPIFSHLDHKGARQDGATWADTVYEPAEMSMRVTLTARTPENFRRLVRRWFAAWDPEKTGKLTWTTPESGEWWCYPRLMHTPPEKLDRNYARVCSQTFTWMIRNEDAFWRSHDSVSEFGFQAWSAFDKFNRDDSGTLGARWDQDYYGAGAGVCETEDGFFGNDSVGRAKWVPSGNDQRGVVNRWLGGNETQTVTVVGSPTGGNFRLTFNGQQTANIARNANAAGVQSALEALSNIAPGDVSVGGGPGGTAPYSIEFTGTYAGTPVPEMTVSHTLTGGTDPHVTVATTTAGTAAVTATDNQLISLRLGSFFQFPFPDNGYVDILGRMNSSSNSYIRARIGANSITLSRFNAGVETVMRSRFLLLPPIWGEKWSLQCGTATNARHFKILRGGFPVVDFKESGTGSLVGASYRGAGFGMEAGDGILTQRVPASVNEWAMGDNVEVTQSGHLHLTNFGDQPASPDLIVYGPGTFKFGNGPDVDPTIEFGPLVEGQVALIKTAPGQRAVYDLTTEQTQEQDLPFFQDFISRLVSLVFNNNVPPLIQWFESLFGIAPVQGNLYSLLRGRWTRRFPARPVADAPVTSTLAVEVTGGNASTRVIASMTPKRRWPE